MSIHERIPPNKIFEHNNFITSQPSSKELDDLFNLFIIQARRRRDWMKNKTSEYLITTGEFPGVLTNFDPITGSAKQILIKDEALALTERHLYLQMLSHPSVLFAERMMARIQYYKVIKDIPLVDKIESEKKAVTFTSFGLGMIEAGMNTVTPRSVKQILGFGLHTYLTRSEVILPIILPSMPTVVGAHSLATLALAGSMGFIPETQSGNQKNSILLVERTKELINTDPFLEGNPERDYILNRALRRIGATLKVDQNVNAIVDQARQLKNAGVQIFRVYNARSEIILMVKTVAALKNAFGDSIQVVVGQVGGPTQAKLLYEAGADSLVVGKADGAACTTALITGSAPNNPFTLYKIIKEGLDIPVWIDGVGGSQGVPPVFALGGSGIMTARTLVGGTFEQPPTGWTFHDQKKPVKLYRGEASPSAKQIQGKLDRAGNPMFPEGVSGIVPATLESTARRLFVMLEDLATALKFADAPSLIDLINRSDPELYEMNPQANRAVQPHDI